MGEPALSDQVTAQLYALSVRQARATVLAMAIVAVLLAATWWVRDTLPDFADTYETLYVYVPCFTALTAVMLWHRRTPPVISSLIWRPSVGRLLATQPWRETPVTVLNVRRTVLVLPDGEHLRVRLPAVVREMVAVAGRVWLVGPDDGGTTWAVRVDGLGTVWSARRVRPVAGTTAPSTGEPIASMWVRLVVERLRVPLVIAMLLGAWGLIRLLMIGPWWDLLVSASYVLLAVAFWLRFRYLARLQPTGGWRRAEATAPSWRVRRNGLADGTVTLSLSDGTGFTAQLERVPLDLFANVVREKSLWVAGNQVVGFPHYPIVVSARCTPA